MQLGLTLTWLFIFPDTGLSGRIRGSVLSSEAGMVDKGQMTRVTESPAKSGLYLGGFPLSNCAVRPPTSESLVGMW